MNCLFDRLAKDRSFLTNGEDGSSEGRWSESVTDGVNK